MLDNSLQFESVDNEKGNSLQTICTIEENNPIKNLPHDLKKYTGIHINKTLNTTNTTEEDHRVQKAGQWDDTFLKWVGKEDGKSIYDSFNDARTGKWKQSKDGSEEITKQTIYLMREVGNNNGWDN
eukprot:10570221-Ditylum_brightwellii.AAC.1